MKQPTPTTKGTPKTVSWRLKRHRRLVAAVLAALSVAFGLAAVRPPEPVGVRVLVAADDLPGGTPLREQDVRLVALPPTMIPEGALRARAVGRILTGPVRRGEVITDTRLLSGRLLKTYGPGVVATPVRVADAATVRLLRPGDQVDVLTAGTTTGLEIPDVPQNDPATGNPPADGTRPDAPTDPAPDGHGTHRTDDADPRPLPDPHQSGHPNGRVVAAALPVIALLRDDAAAPDQGGLIVLATTRAQAAALAGAAGTRLSVTIVAD